MPIVTNHQKGIIRLLKRKIELRPGDNDVSQELWDSVKKSQLVVQLISMKRLSVSFGGKGDLPLAPAAEPKPQAEASKQLSKDMSAKDAIELVKTSDDAAWLQACAESESRSTVLSAIEARIEDLLQLT